MQSADVQRHPFGLGKKPHFVYTDGKYIVQIEFFSWVNVCTERETLALRSSMRTPAERLFLQDFVDKYVL